MIQGAKDKLNSAKDAVVNSSTTAKVLVGTNVALTIVLEAYDAYHNPPDLTTKALSTVLYSAAVAAAEAAVYYGYQPAGKALSFVWNSRPGFMGNKANAAAPAPAAAQEAAEEVVAAPKKATRRRKGDDLAITMKF